MGGLPCLAEEQHTLPLPLEFSVLLLFQTELIQYYFFDASTCGCFCLFSVLPAALWQQIIAAPTLLHTMLANPLSYG